MRTTTTPLQRAINKRGWAALGRACDTTPQAIRKWHEAGRLPRSEFVGETDYAERIERETGGEVTAEQLLDWSRQGWQQARAS